MKRLLTILIPLCVFISCEDEAKAKANARKAKIKVDLVGETKLIEKIKMSNID